jgi:glycosyltransferase involved in cell wall biosynthesis
MRVGFFSPTINRIGGGEWVTLNMIYALKNKKHKVIVYSAEKINHGHIKEFFGHNLKLDGEVRISPNIFDPYSLENIYPNLLKSYMFRIKCDFLIDTFSNTLFPWVDAAYFHGRPKVTRLPKGVKGAVFVPYKAFLIGSTKRFKAKEKVLMACSRHVAKTVEAVTGLNVNVLYPPISDFFKINGKAVQKSNTVVSVTRISDDKQPETILKIAKLTRNNIKFIIIGSCRTSFELRVLKNLQRLVHDLNLDEKVRLLINVSRIKQREILQKAKAYLHPFVSYEAFGISVVEAMSAGCVPIVPDVGGLKEIVPKHLRYKSIEEAAALLEEALNAWSPSKACDIVEASNKFSQTSFCQEFLRTIGL